MPDRLETRLLADRDRLERALLKAEQPPLGTITRRASALRRRHRLTQLAATAAVALVVGGASIAVAQDHPRPAAQTSTEGVWTSDGITVNGLTDPPADLPGQVIDVEFVDADRGYLLTVNCISAQFCTILVGTTVDGGRTWTSQQAPGRLGVGSSDHLPALVATGSQVSILSNPDNPTITRASSLDGGLTWSTQASDAPPNALPAIALPGDAHLILLPGGTVGPGTGVAMGAATGGSGSAGSGSVGSGNGAAGGSCGRRVAAVVAHHDGDGLGVVNPPSQPATLDVCWAAQVRAGDGSWWVGGSQGGRPAVSVSRDGGSTWSTRPFGTEAGRARVAILGQDVYAVLVDPVASPERLIGIALSTDGGRNWGAPRPAAPHASISGDLVPLLDGRLLLVDGTDWQVSADHGGTWRRAAGLHPTSRLARTGAGYVAYGLTKIYTAFSLDGSTWQRLNAT